MIDALVRDLQLLRKADTLIVRIWLSVMARRAGLIAFAALIAVFGLAMANIAGLFALQTSIGPVWAAASVAAADLALAAVVMTFARNQAPGLELDLALDVRRMAIDAVQADARDMKASIDALGQEIRDVKQTIVSVVHNPLDAAAQRLLVPAAISIFRALRPKPERE